MILDALTYAGNRKNLNSRQGDPRPIFVEGSIGDFDLFARLLKHYQARAASISR